MLTQFPSKKAAQDCYEGDYQNIIPLRKGAIDMNFRIVEKKIQFFNQKDKGLLIFVDQTTWVGWI